MLLHTGLDGFQLLVLAIEGAARRKVPEAAKDGASLIASLLFLLAFANVLISDVVALGGPALPGVSGGGALLGTWLRGALPSLVLGVVAASILKQRSPPDADATSSSGPRSPWLFTSSAATDNVDRRRRWPWSRRPT